MKRSHRLQIANPRQASLPLFAPNDANISGPSGRTIEAKRCSEANASMARSSSPRAPRPAREIRLRERALSLLARREYSREELYAKLAQARARGAKSGESFESRRSERDADIAHVVEELARQGWQSDERYAEAIVRRLAAQASRRYIEHKLAEAGISKTLAQAALAQLDTDEREVARALWQRRFGSPPRDERERQRQIRFLLARGFHLADAFRIVPKPAGSAAEAHAEETYLPQPPE
ncbi:MAG: recombination regulator RecX [Casimicrobiaceae bacterium]|nr:recombination regulator RecX [Casimicrobiaceae bacterium]MDW8312346.1 regulatory protein RecX [Burkholderiales bacterium]